MPFCPVKEVDINYLEGNQKNHRGKKAIIYIHGAGGNAGRWEHQLEQLSDILGDKYYSAAIDLPGHGQSGGEACGQVFLYREWVREFLDAMEIEEVIVAGHSMGGAIALDFVMKYPQMVKGLILVGSADRFKVPQERLEAYKRGEYTWEWARVGFASAAPTHLVDKLFEESQQSDPWTRYMDFLACSRYKGKNLENITSSTLIVCGTEDINTPPKLSKRLAENIKGAKLTMIENAAHQVMLEQPEAVNRTIASFLERL